MAGSVKFPKRKGRSANLKDVRAKTGESTKRTAKKLAKGSQGAKSSRKVRKAGY